MRNLHDNELSIVAAGNMFQDLTSIVENGVTSEHQSLGVLSLSLGITAGGLISLGSVWLTPFCSLAILGGWYLYSSEQAQQEIGDLIDDIGNAIA